MKNILLTCLLVIGFQAYAQQSYTITTSATTTAIYSTVNPSAFVFGFKNVNSYPIKITKLSTYAPAVAVTYTLWYHTTAIAGAPSAISLANGWVQHTSATVTPSAIGVNQILSNINLVIPANTIYRLCIQTSNNGPYYATANTSADFVTAHGVEIYTQANPISPTYGGPFPGPPTASTPRGFYGSITFEKHTYGTNNAGVSTIELPQKFCGNTTPVIAKIRNSGSNQINNVTVNWDIDGVLQTPINLTALLDTAGGTGINDTSLNIGTVNFLSPAAKILRIWTSNPNFVTDTVTYDDTLSTVIKPGLSGLYTIGNNVNDYNSIGAAVNDLNRYGICGPVTFNVDAGSVYTESPIILTQTGTSLAPIIFQKSGGGNNPIVYGKNGGGALDAVIALAGVSHITFNGIDVADSISNTTAAMQMEFGYGITNSALNVGASNNTIKNCNITLRRNNTATIGLAQSTLTAATSLAGANHNNRYENIKVSNSYNGILLQGTALFPDSGNVITSTGGDTTIVGANTPNDIGGGTTVVTGINVAEQRNVEVSKCIVRNLAYTSTGISQGIWLNNTNAAINYGTANISQNTIHNINRITTTSATGTIIGIRVELAVLATARVYNNLIYGIESVSFPTTATANQTIRGISHGNTTGTGFAEYYHNTVAINSATANVSSAAFWKGTGASVSVLRNNIFTNTTVAQTVSKHYAVYFSAGGSLVTSNNLLWVTNSNGFIGYTSATDRATLPAYAASISSPAPTTGNEQGSAFVNPNFASPTNFNFTAATPASASGCLITAFPITTDINGTTRTATTPTIGAYETTQLLIDSSAPIISNINVTSSSNPIVYADITDNNTTALANNVFLWYRHGTTGAFSALVPDSTPSASINGRYKWSNSLAALTNLGMYQFYITARDANGAGLTIAVNPIYAINFSGFSSSDPANYLNNPDASANTYTFNKTAILAGGTYTVGSTGTYTNLTSVANLLSASEITGNVVFELLNSYNGTVGETYPITFNPIVVQGGQWSVTIRPAIGSSALETSGYPLVNSTPLIILSGSSRLTFDGRPGGTGSTSQWLIRNQQTNAPCFQFVNGAQFDTLRYLNIESRNATTTSGSLVFGTSSSAGNSNNTIDNCIIRDRSDSTGVPLIGIYSTGTTTATNSNNTISNNHIFNFSQNAISVTATGNGSNWRIVNNSIYSTFSNVTANTCISFIPGTTSVSNIIEGNYIGGSAPLCGNSPFVNTGNIAWRGIVCNTGTTDSSYITNNVIQNINLSGTGSGTYAAIETTGGTNSINGNTIGHNATQNSIQVSLLGTIISIWINNANNYTSIINNTIANVNSTGNTTAIGHNGIRVTTAITTAPLIISGNTIHSLKANNPTTSTTTASMVGILSIYAGVQQQISNNTIYNLVNTSQTGNTIVMGINITNASAAGNISKNHVYDLNNLASAATATQVIGIHVDLASAINITNNMVALGNNVDSVTTITGIMDKSAGTNNTVYHNTVYISGTPTNTGATSSFAYRRTTAAATNVRNNIFYNTRSSTQPHFAIANTTSATGWKSNFNNLFTSNIANVGSWLNTSTDFTTWKTTSLHDSSSVNVATSFASANDLHLISPSIGNMAFASNIISGIATDFDGDIRNTTLTYMGADEKPLAPLPVSILKINATAKGNNVLVTWITASESNCAQYSIERSYNGNDFTHKGKVNCIGNNKTTNKYEYEDTESPLLKNNLVFYRLQIIDENGERNYSEVVSVSLNSKQQTNKPIAYPIPFDKELTLSINLTTSTEVTIRIKDISGKLVYSSNQQALQGENVINLTDINSLREGIYFMNIETTYTNETIKLIKQ